MAKKTKATSAEEKLRALYDLQLITAALTGFASFAVNCPSKSKTSKMNWQDLSPAWSG